MSDALQLNQIDAYIEQLFARDDAATTGNLEAARAAGLPAIEVSPNQGRLLYLLAKMSSATRILEVGTLGGYSTTWLARALPGHGLVTSLELEQKHADIATQNLSRAGVLSKVEIRVGPAADTLRRLIETNQPAFDFVFIDADKPAYPLYLELALRLSRPGTVIVADNVIRNGAVMDAATSDVNARAARAFNALIASHPRLESIVLPIVRTTIDGMSISLVKD